ncbi:MAG: sigma-70 family RNA polymerase sigma factor [Deltaproteobacteria bacterium]|nr:sigma-70 family RNA polymerase sigma factor [Deltaproteobacteria bacterium]
MRRALRILGSEDSAREVLQEVFVSLVDRPAQFQGNSSLLTWLYSATTHAALNRLRNHRNRARILELHPLDAQERAGLEDQTEARRILARVPEKLARVAIYYYFDQLTHDEISELLGCSRRQVGNLLERFRAEATAGDRS